MYRALINALPDVVAITELLEAQIAAIQELAAAQQRRDSAQLARDFAKNKLIADGVEGSNQKQRDAAVAAELVLFDNTIAAAQDEVNEQQLRLDEIRAALRVVDMLQRDADQEIKIRELDQRKIEADLKAMSLKIKERELAQNEAGVIRIFSDGGEIERYKIMNDGEVKSDPVNRDPFTSNTSNLLDSLKKEREAISDSDNS